MVLDFHLKGPTSTPLGVLPPLAGLPFFAPSMQAHLQQPQQRPPQRQQPLHCGQLA